ncbi:glycosyltransferase family 2 protein [Acinetobacter soli]|uniref:glycosyltransferase family 2 protein n=1 Tax=Acinetobacter soli TaxID=487316 RepID=UPI0026E0F4F3|nr:glycosyltransferase family 2 protein [Acinetobacter soli]
MSQIPNAISVVIPTYNRAHLIKESLQSVLDQTLQPYEIIVVDDFSTDNTEEVVKSLNSSLIKYVKNQRKKGANGARNTGILMAQGEYIAFHDSDDIWFPEKLNLQKDLVNKNEGVNFCFCSMSTKGRFGKKNIPNKKIGSNNIFKKLEQGNFISTQTIFMSSILAKKILFDEDIKRLQDWDFVLRARDYCNIEHLDKCLVRQNINNFSITKRVSAVSAYKDIYNKYPFLQDKSIENIYFKNRIYLIENKNFFIAVKVFYLRILIVIMNFLK